MQKTGEWGEFFPKNISCFGYNEGTAQEFFPMEKEQARREGFSWFDEIHQQTPDARRCRNVEGENDRASKASHETFFVPIRRRC
jgi:hypothetical protein